MYVDFVFPPMFLVIFFVTIALIIHFSCVHAYLSYVYLGKHNSDIATLVCHILFAHARYVYRHYLVI